ncbi:hypothetical protein F5Y04DRAFT_191870 [Hypomontagnella monticulosa]|nr:hypothetical protein F5Y04DRAFT_191870 [Hypomontagnella monticulosa]
MAYPHFAPTVLWNLPLPSELGINKPAGVFAFSQDDKLLVTLHDGQGGILWDLTANSSPRKIEFDKNDACLKQSVKAAAMIGVSLGLIVAFGTDHPAQHYNILDEDSGLKASPSNTVLPAATDVGVSRDGKVATFTTGTTVEVWDALTLHKTRVLTSEVPINGPFERVAISQDNNYTAAVNSQGKLSAWGLTDDFHKVSRNEEVGVGIGNGWSATNIGLNKTFVMAVLRKRGSADGDAWMLVTWGYKYEGPENTLYGHEYPKCALACVAPNAEFNITLSTSGSLSGKDSVLCRIFGSGQGVSKKGKILSCGISGSSKMLAAARTNGRLTVWRLYTTEPDPSKRYPAY